MIVIRRGEFLKPRKKRTVGQFATRQTVKPRVAVAMKVVVAQRCEKLINECVQRK